MEKQIVALAMGISLIYFIDGLAEIISNYNFSAGVSDCKIFELMTTKVMEYFRRDIYESRTKNN